MEDFFEEDEKKITTNSFDIKHYIFKLSKNYLWIIFCLILSVIIGNLYLRYSIPKYQVSSYILIGGGELESSTSTILQNAGATNVSTDNEAAVDNEIFILKSHIITGEVVDSLKLYQSFVKFGTIKKQPVLQEALPATIVTKRKFPEQQTPLYHLVLNNSSFVLEYEEHKFAGLYGKPFIFNQDTIRIIKNPEIALRGGDDYGFQLLGRLSTIQSYISRLTVIPAKSGGTGLLQVSVIDELPLRAENFINALIQKYNLTSQKYKNQAINSALNFLGKRLSTVGTELQAQEEQVRDFKASNKIYDISASATELLTGLQSLDAQKTQNVYQEQLLQLVESSIKSYSGKEEIVATASGLQDPVLLAQIAAYNEMVMQKQSVLSTGTEADPRLGTINDQLAGLRTNILKNISNIRRQFNKTHDYYSGQENRLSGKFEALPAKEKTFVELNRELGIKQTLYLFLLQKREETEIQLVSSDVVKSRTVDDVLNNGIITPSGITIYLFALLIGLCLPALIIFIQVFLNRKIETKGEIEKGTNVPLLGELSFSQSVGPVAITTSDRSAIAEQIRTIRANLSFIGGDSAKKVFIVTSSISGEGKSFVSLNLANSLAISDKRVIILELDLRKPVISTKLDLKGKSGITNYLIDETMLPEDVIQPLKDYPNLYVISSGPIPPNPGELIINKRMNMLLDYLRQHFDYVILDSPPIGLVSDALSLAKLSDISLFVIRPDYSDRSALRILNDLYVGKKLSNLSLVINGIQSEKGYGYGYGNRYGYSQGYGYGYYSDSNLKQNNFGNGIKNFFKRS